MSRHQQIQIMKHAHMKLKIQQIMIKRQSKWKIFPITISNGAIPLTETGYKPINSKISDFGQYELILSGNTPVVLSWKGSTLIYQKNKGITNPVNHKTTKQDQFYTKQYKVGDYWNAYLIDDNSGVDLGSLNGNSIFKTISTTRQYTLVMFEEQITIDDYLQFFVVFNDTNENIGGNTGKNQDRQVLYISNVTNYYSPYNGAFSMQVLTFSSVNDRLTATGQTTQGFLNWSSAGSGYAFPTVINGIVTLNRTLMRDIGVRFAHIQTYGLELFCSNYYYGRPIIQGQAPNQVGTDEIFEQKVFASRRLFIAGNNDHSSTTIKNNGGLFAGINDQITTSSHPETTFYNIMDAKPTGYTNYSDWQKFLAAKQFDMLAQKDFKGLLSCNKSLATNSNGSAIGESKFFWDSLWNITNIKGEYNVDMSSNFKYKDPDTNLIIGSPTVDYSKILQKYMSAILNFNSVVFSSLIQMPYDSQQWLPFALSSIPLIGKLLNILSLGIPVGFIINQNSEQYKKMPFFNGFMSAFFASNLSSIIGESTGSDNWLIPLNVFSNTSDFALGKMLGANVSTRAMLMKLSDRISVYPWDPTTGKKLSTREQISTVDLSQNKNGKVYIMAEDTEFLDIASPLTNLDTEMQWNPTPNGIKDGSNYAYIIDTIVTQSLHQGEERHTFYSDNPYTYQGDSNELSVAQYRYKNKGALTGNAFNWTTVYKLNHDEYKESEETTFSYPANILPPTPQNIAKKIVIMPSNPSIDISLGKIITYYPDSTNLLKYDSSYWKNNVFPLIKILNIPLNFKDYLDPTLLINNFNDLKRYYKSIEIYLSYNYITQEWIPSQAKDSFGKSTNESFVPNKTQDYVLQIDLNNLNIYETEKELIEDEFSKKVTTPAFPNFFETGVSYIGVKPNNIDNLYNINNQSGNLHVSCKTGDREELSLDWNSKTYLGFLYNSKDFKFTLQFFPLVMQIQGSTNVLQEFHSLARSIINYKLIISKIILNPR